MSTEVHENIDWTNIKKFVLNENEIEVRRFCKFLNKNKVMITLATAHPSKFIDSVQSALGKVIAQPIEMKQLYSKTERVIHAPNEVNFYKSYINREI